LLKKWAGPALAVAMVWFTTHFGGGFASGRQLVEFYVQYGWYAAFMPLVSQFITALVFYYTLQYTIIFKTYDYSTWANHFYRPYEKVLGPLYGIRYVTGMFIVASVAIATAGSTLEKLLGMPYFFCAVITAIAVFLLTIFGADVVRKAANLFALFIVLGLIIIYSSNIIGNAGQIGAVIKAMPSPKGFWPIFWKTLSYASYQAGVGSWVAVADVIKTKEEAKRAAILGFLANGIMLQLAAFGILGHYPDILPETVPTFYMLEHGVGDPALLTIASLLIVIGAFTTAVNVIFGVIKRFSALISKGKPVSTTTNAITSAALIALSWGMSLVGLIKLVNVGYGYMGYTALPLTVVPILYWGIRHSNKLLPAKADNVGEVMPVDAR
jgi:uncharacterized membrane protein YkvI